MRLKYPCVARRRGRTGEPALLERQRIGEPAGAHVGVREHGVGDRTADNRLGQVATAVR